MRICLQARAVSEKPPWLEYWLNVLIAKRVLHLHRVEPVLHVWKLTKAAVST